MGQIIKFASIIGLRPSEVVESVRLLSVCLPGGHRNCYNPERCALEHFRFPEIFLRQTKKAYVSFVTPEMIAEVVGVTRQVPSLNAIILACRKVGIKMEMHLTRKIFASYLRKEEIQPEVVEITRAAITF
jgi:hypothetical protein